MDNTKRIVIGIVSTCFIFWGVFEVYQRWSFSEAQKETWSQTKEYAEEIQHKEGEVEVLYENDLVDAPFEIPLSYIRDYQDITTSNTAVFGYPKYFAYHKEEVPIIFYKILLEEAKEKGWRTIVRNRNYEREFISEFSEEELQEYQKEWIKDIENKGKADMVVITENLDLTQKSLDQYTELASGLDDGIKKAIQYSLSRRPELEFLEDIEVHPEIDEVFLLIENIADEKNITFWKGASNIDITLVTRWKKQTEDPREWIEYVEKIARKYEVQRVIFSNTCSLFTHKTKNQKSKDIDKCYKEAIKNQSSLK